MTETEPSAPLPNRDERRPLTEAEIVAQYQAKLDPAALRRDKMTRLLGEHRLIGGRCRCGFDARLDYFRYEQHVTDVVLAVVDDDRHAARAEAAEAERDQAREVLARVDLTAMTREMHEYLGAHVNYGPPSTAIPDDLRDIRIALLDEEVGEYRDAAQAGDLVGIADGLADLVYVAYGTAHTYGINLDAVLAEVHRSNMTKSRNPDGGKFIKGPGYSPPDIARALGAEPYGPECVFTADGCRHFEHRHAALSTPAESPTVEGGGLLQVKCSCGEDHSPVAADDETSA